MDIGGVQRALIGFALFDMWEASISKTHRARKASGSPMVAAAAAAFERYIEVMETRNAALISGVAGYALNPGGASVSPVTVEQMAPFLALNVTA